MTCKGESKYGRLEEVFAYAGRPEHGGCGAKKAKSSFVDFGPRSGACDEFAVENLIMRHGWVQRGDMQVAATKITRLSLMFNGMTICIMRKKYRRALTRQTSQSHRPSDEEHQKTMLV